MGDTCSKSVYKDCCTDPKKAIKLSDNLARSILEGNTLIYNHVEKFRKMQMQS